MAEYSESAPLFASRYRFEPVPKGWDTGRSGFTHLVYDLEKKRLGVIKRAEIKSQETVNGLKNEIAALFALRFPNAPNLPNVPEVYETGEAKYGSKNYFYMVIEYIDAMRVENNLTSLNAIDRAEILTQFFDLLAKTHKMGIVNGDIDLKHLFWRRDKRQLIVIDWGNSKLDVNPNRKTEFAYDLARSAEIIFSLVTRQGPPPATGSLTLPNDPALFPGLAPLPVPFSNLCTWAPRTPSDGAQALYTSQELFEVSNKWFDAMGRSKPHKPDRPTSIKLWLVGGISLLGITFLALLTTSKFSWPAITSVTSTLTITETSTPFPPTNTPIFTEVASPTQSVTVTPIRTPTPSTYLYSPITIFDREKNSDKCWVDEAISPATLVLNDGFFKRTDRDWGFRVQVEHSFNDVVQVDFSPCFLDNKRLGAIAINIWMVRLEVPTYEPGREFGIFLINQSGHRREYTLWIDKDERMYLRVREDDNVTDNLILVVSSNILRYEGEYPRPYYQFPIQIYLQIDNEGSDILYLLAAPSQKPVQAEDIDPNQMIPIDNATLPTFGDIQKVGLVGHGGKTEALIWPLVFFEVIRR